MDDAGAKVAIDKLIAGFFGAFDNRNGQAPSLAALVGFFCDKAVVGRASGADVELYTVTEFALPRVELLAGGALVDFHEAETSCTTHVFGAMAVRTSRYRKAGLLYGESYAGTGTKTFQLVAIESGWRILSLVWMDDEAPVPSTHRQ